MSRLKTQDGTPISRFGFGAMQFGRTADEPAARAMFDACRTAGITHFDTAFAYAAGTSERMLGKLIAPEVAQLFIATKAPNDRPATRQTLRAACADSRARLGLDCIDLYYLHRFDAETPLAETFGAWPSCNPKVPSAISACRISRRGRS